LAEYFPSFEILMRDRIAFICVSVHDETDRIERLLDAAAAQDGGVGTTELIDMASLQEALCENESARFFSLYFEVIQRENEQLGGSVQD
jgi:hypothetical protein